MANTRISMAEAYDNKDVIQQILLMKDTVRNGTYADLSVERGTGADIGKIIFDFTLTSGEHQVFKVEDKAIASTSAAQVGTTVTVTVTYNDGTSDTFTFSTLTGAMTLDTAQTATAKKTFSAGIAATDIDATGDLSVGGDAEVSGRMQIGSNLAIEDSSSDSVLSSAGDLKVLATALHVPNTTNGSNTDAAVNGIRLLSELNGYSNMVRTTGNQSIAGQKTFTIPMQIQNANDNRSVVPASQIQTQPLSILGGDGQQIVFCQLLTNTDGSRDFIFNMYSTGGVRQRFSLMKIASDGTVTYPWSA